MKFAQRPRNSPIGATTQRLSPRIRPGQLVSARVDEREHDETEHAAVARHPAFPDSQNRERIAQHLRPVKEDVAEPAAEHHAEERGPGDEIAQRGLGQIGIAAFREHAQERETARRTP